MKNILLQELIEDSGYDTEGYYDSSIQKYVLSFKTDNPAKAMVEIMHVASQDDEVLFEEMTDLLKEVQTNPSNFYNQIVYFPSIKMPGESEEEEDE